MRRFRVGLAQINTTVGDLDGNVRKIVEGSQVRLDEGRLEQEILGRVAGDRQLREGNHRCAERARSLDRVHDHPDVTLEVAHRGIDLSQGDAQASHGPYCTGAAGHLL